MKFMAHSKREKLTTEDINSALRLRNVEALYGYSTRDPLRFVRVAGQKDLFYVEDQELDFNELFSTTPLGSNPLLKMPKCPRQISLQVHWLAVQGVQPQVPQNPNFTTTSSEVSEPSAKKTSEDEAAVVSATTVVSSEGDVEVKQTVKHVLSKEQQLYYKKITDAVLAVKQGTSSDHEELLHAALTSLSTDPGIHQLLPYFTKFIATHVTNNLRQLRLLRALMQMIEAMLKSSYLHLEPYLHQLMPAMLTCLVGKRLCESPTENHWELRDFAAQLVARICRRYGKEYRDLQPRITKTLLHAFLDPVKPLTTHYGAIVGLGKMGPLVVQSLLLPNMVAYLNLLLPELTAANPIKRLEANKCYGALLNVAGGYFAYAMDLSATTSSLKSKTNKDAETDKKTVHELLPDFAHYYKQLYDIFGEALLPYLKQNREVLSTIL
jgi:transcription initiation factor TFIID subunit 6